MAKEFFSVKITRYMTTEEGLEVVPAAAFTLSETDLTDKIETLIKQVRRIELPPKEVIGAPLRPMTRDEIDDYLVRTGGEN